MYCHAVRHCRIATQFCNGAMAKLGLGVLLLSWAHAALEDLTDGFHVDVDETSVSAGFAHTCALPVPRTLAAPPISAQRLRT